MSTSLTKCPYCAEEINPDAIKCKHCGSWLSGDPNAQVPPGYSPAPFADQPKRLYRSSRDKMIFGVCGGLAHYMGVDPTLIRIVVALATFFSAIFPGIVLYIILGFVIPSDDTVGS
jgi:phage shock protein C